VVLLEKEQRGIAPGGSVVNQAIPLVSGLKDQVL
jgi:hypothetical protein